MKVIYWFSEISIMIPMAFFFFLQSRKNALKIYIESHKSQRNPEKQEQSRKNSPDFMLYYRRVVIKT